MPILEDDLPVSHDPGIDTVKDLYCIHSLSHALVSMYINNML